MEAEARIEGALLLTRPRHHHLSPCVYYVTRPCRRITSPPADGVLTSARPVQYVSAAGELRLSRCCCGVVRPSIAALPLNSASSGHSLAHPFNSRLFRSSKAAASSPPPPTLSFRRIATPAAVLRSAQARGPALGLEPADLLPSFFPSLPPARSAPTLPSLPPSPSSSGPRRAPSGCCPVGLNRA